MISGVCDGCGGELKPMKTVDNGGNPTYWGGCERCSKYCWGVSKFVYKIAKRLVEERCWRPYSFIKESDGAEYYNRSQIEGTVSKVLDVINAMKGVEAEQVSCESKTE